VNAFDADEDGTGDRVVVDAVRYPWYFRVAGDGDGFDPDPLGVLWRWTIDLDQGTVTEGPVETGCPFDQIELPRIDESRTGRPNRHLWAVEQPSTTEMRGLRHHDRTAGTTGRWVPPPGDQNSEPVFVKRPGTTEEGDGWIVAAVYRAATHTTDVVVLDALDLPAGPVATIHLPVRVPAGFHGVWLPN
jgi:carotenoid cleavage dioxygenase